MENLIESNQTYCLYGGSHLAMRVMARIREYKTFDLVVIENEADAIRRVRGDTHALCEDWQVMQMSKTTSRQKEMLKRTRIVFAGVACSVPQGAYVEVGLANTIRRLRRRNTNRRLPELALVVGGHKFVREQIGDPGYYKDLLAPFHEYLTYDKVRYLVG
jgi:hypothetical protein